MLSIDIDNVHANVASWLGDGWVTVLPHYECMRKLSLCSSHKHTSQPPLMTFIFTDRRAVRGWLGS